MSRNTEFRFPPVAFLWPALAAASASRLAAALAKDLARLAAEDAPAAPAREPSWATPSRVLLDLKTVRLRDFSTGATGVATLVCAPFALHGATVTDLAPGHSLVEALSAAGLPRVLVTDWRSASEDMRLLAIDNYLADLNVLVDRIGGPVDLVGLCQGGWMALVYAACFPDKVRKLVLAGAPIDIAAGESRLSRLAKETPLSVFSELVELGEGRVLGQRALRLWGPETPDADAVRRLLQTEEGIDTDAFRRLEARFRDWYAWTVDLPGTYYLQVVEWLFKENRLASGRFVALGRTIDLSGLDHPLFLLAARDDEVVAAEQIFATERLVGSPRRVVRSIAPGTHLGLFMGRAVLTGVWPQIVRWLSAPMPEDARVARPAA